ncbi:charged multivesicular body protein 7 [Danaus plexippus]|uniref:charged multivesicular body protein 7 n=1 Tax=Danaus plexippus TaxID=13037 RepID=UPI002AAF8372|nr:charged multivesicular body protein 7 [Danaus plexippus]
MGLSECGIPEDKLPPCWSDDVRMNALFAPFRLKVANPESWDMKMKFWSDMVRQWCRCKTDPIVSAADVRSVFQRRGRTAACLDIVIEEMYHNGDLSPISKYQQILHNGPESWVRWGARLAFKPAAIAITAVTSLLPARQATDNNGLPKASIDSTQRFVLESAVKEQANELLNNFPAGSERIGTIDELMRSSGHTNREVYEVLLGYLVSQGMAVKSGDVVKIAEPNKKVQPVTEMDTAMVKLMSAESRLSDDVARLSRDVSVAESEARAAMKLGNKIAAKNHLRRKMRTQQKLQQCEAALENIKELMLQARNSDVTSAVVDTYRNSAKAMKQTMRDGGLDEDSVYHTMDDLKDVMDSYNEVEKALGGVVEDVDVDDLEHELKELLEGGDGGGGDGVCLPSPPRQQPERENSFVFDGEERMLADLRDLGEEKGREKEKEKEQVLVAEGVADSEKSPKAKVRASQPWYPPSDWSNMNTNIDNMAKDYAELRLDNRLHPGQPLDVDFTTPPQYTGDYHVRDHRAGARVWLYNSRDELAPSTEYCSSESPGKETDSKSFQMAPGGERKKSEAWPKDDVQDLERRLKNLRGLNL